MKFLFSSLLVATLPLSAAVLTVTNTADAGAGSLRQALTDANSGDTVTFGGAAFAGSGKSIIRLTSASLPLKPIHLLGIAAAGGGNQVQITGDADASGTPTAGDLPIFSATPTGATSVLTLERIDFINTGSTTTSVVIFINAVSLSELSLIRCNFIGNGGGVTNKIMQLAGGNCNYTINRCQFRNTNTACSLNISQAANILMSLSRFTENTNDNSTSHCDFSNSSQVEINRCVFEDNENTSIGGGLRLSNNTAVTISQSLFHNNGSSATGGAITINNNQNPSSEVLIKNCTLTANIARRGSAIDVSAAVINLEHCTITANRRIDEIFADSGAVFAGNNASIRFKACVIAGNEDEVATSTATRYPDVDFGGNGMLVSQGGNIIGSNSGNDTTFAGVNDRVGTEAQRLNPGLLPLSDNGGETITHALHPLSIARDFATTSTIGDDQRDFSRSNGGTIRDAGAYELQLVSYADWAATRLASFPVSQRQVRDDPDDDGLSNGIEYIQGSAPGIKNERFDKIEMLDGTPYYSFTIANDVDFDSVYSTIEVSSDLSSWEDFAFNSKLLRESIMANSNATRTRYLFRAPPTGREPNDTSRFYRMTCLPPGAEIDNE